MTAPCVWSRGNAAWGHAAYNTSVRFAVKLSAFVRWYYALVSATIFSWNFGKSLPSSSLFPCS